MRASAAGRRFQSESWNGLVSLIVAAVGKSKTTAQERIDAASALEEGRDVTIAGVLIHPQR
jgi:predicted metal-dependent hydrolase